MQQEQVLVEIPDSAKDYTYWYNTAAQLMAQGQLSEREIANHLESSGASDEEATRIVLDLREEFGRVKKERAKKDMLYGALWCGGGTILTLSNIGFIFWGAIIFGGIQLVRGLVNYNED